MSLVRSIIRLGGCPLLQSSSKSAMSETRKYAMAIRKSSDLAAAVDASKQLITKVGQSYSKRIAEFFGFRKLTPIKGWG